MDILDDKKVKSSESYIIANPNDGGFFLELKEIPGEVVAEASGTVDGVIMKQPRGGQGFGYDPLFLVPELGRTFAELDALEKNTRSHRGRALRHFCHF